MPPVFKLDTVCSTRTFLCWMGVPARALGGGMVFITEVEASRPDAPEISLRWKGSQAERQVTPKSRRTAARHYT